VFIHKIGPIESHPVFFLSQNPSPILNLVLFRSDLGRFPPPLSSTSSHAKRRERDKARVRDNMEPTGSGSDVSRQVQVRFVTRLQPPLRVPPTSLAVPSHLTRLGLSEIVNLLLKSCTAPQTPFFSFDHGNFVLLYHSINYLSI
jgi:NLE (NUC135) domain